MTPNTRKLTFALAVLLIARVPSAAQQRPYTVAEIFKFARLSDPEISPDGKTIAFVISHVDLAGNRSNSDIWLVPVPGGTPRRLTNSPKSDDRPRWSPDGRRIAFQSTRDGTPQIYLIDLGGGEAQKLTSLSTGASGQIWSPDGQWIAFTSDVYPDCNGDDACNKKKDEAKEKDPVKARWHENLQYRHWVAYDEGTRTHLFVAPVAGGAPRDLTPGRWDAVPFYLFSSADEYDFSPDGRELAFAANRTEAPWDNINWDIFTVPVTGGEIKPITTNTAPDQQPRYSPDGRYIGYKASRRYNYESDRMELMVYDRQDRQMRSITPNFDRWVQNIYWAPDSKRLYLTAEDQGNVPVFTVALDGGEVKTIVGGRAWNEGVCLSRDGRLLAFTRRDLARVPEVYTATTDGRALNRVTGVNDEFLKQVRTIDGEEIRYRGAGGSEVHAFVIKPSHFDAAKKYPMVVVIHGGPQQMFGNAFRSEYQLYAAEGYVVLIPNPRGSPGYGQRFIDEINKDWGGKVYEDIMAGVDYMVQTGYIDPSRIGATGGSFGGFMVNWIAGHTNRFKCLISHAGLANMWSMYGSTDELHFPDWEFGGAPWDNPELYDRLSPIRYAKNFKTPMLITHGDLDYRVPITEGEQMFSALRKLGVPSKFLRFPDEGHWILKPQNSARWYRTMLEWCASYLKR